jgi:hypothetical protein
MLIDLILIRNVADSSPKGISTFFLRKYHGISSVPPSSSWVMVEINYDHFFLNASSSLSLISIPSDCA